MSIPRCIVMLFLSAALGQTAFAADAAAPPPRVAAETALMDKVLPDLNLQGVSLEDTMDFLQQACPGFKAVVVRDQDVADGEPRVNLKLKNITLGQVWTLLQMSYPCVAEQVEAPGPEPVFVLRVKFGDTETRRPPPLVKVYHLRSTLASMEAEHNEGKPPARKELLDQLLSLIKATLAQVPGRTDPPAVLQVHEETFTLIFKGSAEQKSALEDVLKSMERSSPDAVAAAAQQVFEQRIQTLEHGLNLTEKELQIAQKRLEDEQKISQDRALEAEKLKLQVERDHELEAMKETLRKEQADHQKNHVKDPG